MLVNIANEQTMEGLKMFEEDDYVIRQIKVMVKGLGKFMGLEQIKELLQLNDNQQESITDNELESIIAASKLEIIIVTKTITTEELADELNIGSNHLKKILDNEIVANEEELDQMNQFILENQKYL